MTWSNLINKNLNIEINYLFGAFWATKVLSSHVVERVYIQHHAGFLMDSGISQFSIAFLLRTNKVHVEQVAGHPQEKPMSKVPIWFVEDTCWKAWLWWLVPKLGDFSEIKFRAAFPHPEKSLWYPLVIHIGQSFLPSSQDSQSVWCVWKNWCSLGSP